MKPKIALLLALVLCFVSAGSLFAQKTQNPPNFGAGFEPSPRVASRPSGGSIGTVVYDDGNVSLVSAVTSVTAGNQFDTNNGNPLTSSGTIFTATVYWVSVSGGSAWISFYDQQNGTTANFIDDNNLPASTGFNTYTTFGALGGSVNYVGSSFLFGGWNTVGDAPGFSTGSNGNGFHAMLINDITATGFTRFTDVNAVSSATGNLLIPVELMDFEIVD